MAIPVWSVGQVLTASDVNQWFVPLVARKSADETRATTTTLADDGPTGGSLQVQLAANASYWYALDIQYEGNTAGAGDLKAQMSVPAGAAHVPETLGYDTSGNLQFVSFTGANVWGTNGTGSKRVLKVEGTVLTSSTAGPLKLQWAQGTSNATGTIIHAGSQLTVIRTG